MTKKDENTIEAAEIKERVNFVKLTKEVAKKFSDLGDKEFSELLKKVFSGSSSDSQARFLLQGYMFTEDPRFAEAGLSLWDDILRKGKLDDTLLYNLSTFYQDYGEVLVKKKKYNEAVEYYKKSLSVFPSEVVEAGLIDSRPWTCRQLAVTLNRLNQFDEVREILEDMQRFMLHLTPKEKRDWEKEVKYLEGRLDERQLNEAEQRSIRKRHEELDPKMFKKLIETMQKEGRNTRETVMTEGEKTRGEIIRELKRKIMPVLTEIGNIKKTEKGIEEKLLKIHETVQKKFEILGTDVKKYSEILSNRLKNWRRANEKSKGFMSTGALLLDILPPDADFSGVNVEYCKALETELLTKVFQPYRDFIIAKHEKDMSDYLHKDIEDDDLQPFCKFLQKERKLELGSMTRIIGYLGSQKMMDKSKVFSDFKLFIKERFSNPNFFLKYLPTILTQDKINKYRNGSAHTEPILKDRANECSRYIEEIFDKLLESF